MLGCGKFLSVGGECVVQQVVELLWARPLVVSVASVRVVEFGTEHLLQSELANDWRLYGLINILSVVSLSNYDNATCSMKTDI